MSRITSKRPGLFNYYDTITYDGVTMPNLTARAVLTQLSLNNESLYFTYTIQPNETRPDILAANYYQNSRLDWVILLSNQIVNPRFEWPLTPTQLEELVNKKYGNTAGTVAYYRLAEFTTTTPAAFNALDTNMKTYWQPQYDGNYNVVQYTFKKDSDLSLNPAGYNALSGAEQAYWTSVSNRDKELLDNDSKRNIRLLNKLYIGDITNEIRRVFA